MNRVSVSIGETSGAKVGQRFLVRAARLQSASPGEAAPVYKGEIVLVEIRDDMAFAEILHLADAAGSVGPDDRLKRIEGDEGLFRKDQTTDKTMADTDETTRLFSYSDFITRAATARLAPKSFALSLIRVLDQPGDSDEGYREAMDRMVADVANIARGAFGDTAFGGRHGLNGMIFHLEDVDRETLMTRTLEIEKLAADSLAVKVSIGSACFPFLDFDRADIPENCRKALEHALLLPDPQSRGVRLHLPEPLRRPPLHGRRRLRGHRGVQARPARR